MHLVLYSNRPVSATHARCVWRKVMFPCGPHKTLRHTIISTALCSLNHNVSYDFLHVNRYADSDYKHSRVAQLFAYIHGK